MKLVSNLFLMKFLHKLDVFVYTIIIIPEPIVNECKNEILESIIYQIRRVFYPLILTDKYIFSRAEIDEDITFNASFCDL